MSVTGDLIPLEPPFLLISVSTGRRFFAVSVKGYDILFLGPSFRM